MRNKQHSLKKELFTLDLENPENLKDTKIYNDVKSQLVKENSIKNNININVDEKDTSENIYKSENKDNDDNDNDDIEEISFNDDIENKISTKETLQESNSKNNGGNKTNKEDYHENHDINNNEKDDKIQYDFNGNKLKEENDRDENIFKSQVNNTHNITIDNRNEDSDGNSIFNIDDDDMIIE